MNQGKNINIINKDIITDEDLQEPPTIFNNQLLNITLPNKSENIMNTNKDNKPNIILPLIPDNYIHDKFENITLEEIKKIMEEPKINLEEENYEYEKIYFTKHVKKETESLDTSTKYLSTLDNKENSFYKNISFKTVLHHKRGRKEKEKKIVKNKQKFKKIHKSDDFDNIQRKIQVNYITFLIMLGNDALKNIFGKKTKYRFKDVKYELKKIVTHKYVEYLKKCKYSDIMKMKISLKNKKIGEDSNKRTLQEVCQLSDELKNFFDKNYLYIFQKYYCNIKNDRGKINFDGLDITLSPKTKTLFNLLSKNEQNREKFNNIVNDVYFSEFNYNIEKKFVVSSFSTFNTISAKDK